MTITAIHSKPSLLTHQKLEVSSDGELVVITIGNSELKMHYEDALKISQWIRLRAKDAKRRAGDMSRTWSVIASLDGIVDT